MTRQSRRGSNKGVNMKTIIYRVESDNYQNAYMTEAAYKALRLQMSSGDHGAHIAKQVSKVPKGEQLLELADIDPDAAMSEALKNYPKHLQEFAAKKSFKAGMSGGGLDSYDNYGGPDFGLWVVSVGTNRDADVLTEANYKAALESFGGESETVVIRRFGHWGCGWFEVIMIDPTDRKALETAYDISKALENYPVLDDSLYSELEHEAVESDFDNYQSEFESNICKALGLDRDDLESQMSKREREEFNQDLNQLARFAHEAAASYYGHDDAFITEDNALKMIEEFNRSNGMISDLGDIAELALAACGLEINPNYQPRSDYKAAYEPSIHRSVIEIKGGSDE